jgi:hypothetical protein
MSGEEKERRVKKSEIEKREEPRWKAGRTEERSRSSEVSGARLSLGRWNRQAGEPA